MYPQSTQAPCLQPSSPSQVESAVSTSKLPHVDRPLLRSHSLISQPSTSPAPSQKMSFPNDTHRIRISIFRPFFERCSATSRAPPFPQRREVETAADDVVPSHTLPPR